jgi:hypothetical protein
VFCLRNAPIAVAEAALMLCVHLSTLDRSDRDARNAENALVITDRQARCFA